MSNQDGRGVGEMTDAELDEAVARELFGARVAENFEQLGQANIDEAMVVWNRLGKRFVSKGGSRFAPSTSIADAWLVAEKLQLAVFPRMSAPGWVAGPFRVSMMSPYMAARYDEGEDSLVEVRADLCGKADTAPRAICEAALLAVRARP